MRDLSLRLENLTAEQTTMKKRMDEISARKAPPPPPPPKKKLTRMQVAVQAQALAILCCRLNKHPKLTIYRENSSQRPSIVSMWIFQRYYLL